MTNFTKIKELIEDVEKDNAKAAKGNKAAAKRLRKFAQDLKGLAQALRIECLEVMKADKVEDTPA